MIRTDLLRGIIAQKGLHQVDIANKIGITPKTFYKKMKIGKFSSDEMKTMIEVLEIEDPVFIFFAE